MTLQALINHLALQWRVLTQGGTVIAGAICGVVAEPPLWDAFEDRVWRGAGLFLVACILGGFVIVAKRYRTKKSVTRWAMAGGLCFCTAFSLFMFYTSERAELTAAYNDERLVVGRSVLPHVRQKYPSGLPSNDQLIWEAAGERHLVWAPEDTQRARLHLATLYLALVAAFTLTLLTISQTVSVGTLG